jgi:subtilisin family serine protease
MLRSLRAAVVLALTTSSLALAGEFLVRFEDGARVDPAAFVQSHGGTLVPVSVAGNLYKWTVAGEATPVLRDATVRYVQRNHTLRLPANPTLEANRDLIAEYVSAHPETVERAQREGWFSYTDNPAIQEPPTSAASGRDPLLDDAWGIFQIAADKAWDRFPQGEGITVAVIDSGVDYNHEDLIANIWRNPKEIPGNGKDDDGNGYVDDIVGWDFAANDNKPFDLRAGWFSMILNGGNPGHGTHVAGVIAATRNNKRGIAGVAPKARIMALRFITESGSGTTAGAIGAIDYAVTNGAQIINASWGSESDPSYPQENKALEEAIQRAMARGVIFVAAAGNGRNGVGFNNDIDRRPMVPASMTVPNILTVAAIDSLERLAPFSNFGKKTVHLGAPGVKVLSTTPGNEYQDTVLDLFILQATWDGTSMAAPHVAGALAVLWSQDRSQPWRQVRDRLLSKTVVTNALYNKVATDGRLDLRGAR